VQDSYNIVPVTLAVLLHVIVFGSMFVAFDIKRETAPPILAIKATLVASETAVPPPVVRQPEPEPEPEPVRPDPNEEARQQAEAEKLREDARVERERLQKIEEDKRAAERKSAEDKARREREAEEARERRRKELEEQRQRDIERQREENRLEEERLANDSRNALIAAEAAQIEAQNSTEAQIYQTMIKQKVTRNWARPGTAQDDLSCAVAVTQVPGGEVLSAKVIDSQCNGDAFVKRSVEAAVMRASPLPQPDNPLLFLRNFTITFTYND